MAMERGKDGDGDGYGGGATVPLSSYVIGISGSQVASLIMPSL
jgi:hypothetical protein